MSRSPVRLHLSAIRGPENSIEIDGKDITDRVRDLALHAGASDLTVIQVTYNCLEGVDFDGTIEVRHVCPLAEEGDS